MENNRNLEYTVEVNVVHKYSFTVIASNEDEAEEKAKELGFLPDNEIRENSLDEINVEISSVVCNDEDYEQYLDECDDREIKALGKDENWSEHLEEIENLEWYEEDYLEFLKSDELHLIVDVKEKKKYIKKAQESNNPIIRVFTKGFEEQKDLFLDVSNLKGRKYFYHIPYTETLGSNKWEHQDSYTTVSLDKLIESIDIFDQKVMKISENKAKFLVEKLNLNS